MAIPSSRRSRFTPRGGAGVRISDGVLVDPPGARKRPRKMGRQGVIVSPPVFTQHPQTGGGGEGGFAIFSVEAYDPHGEGVDYLWQWAPAWNGPWTDFNGSEPGVVGWQTRFLVFNPLDPAYHGAWLRCSATNADGTSYSRSAQLIVGAATLYVNAALAGGDDSGPGNENPPDAHALQFLQTDFNPIPNGDGLTFRWESNPNEEADVRAVLAYQLHVNNPDLDVGSVYRISVLGQNLAGLGTVATATNNVNNVDIIDSQRRIEAGETARVYYDILPQSAGWTFNLRFGTGVTTGRGERYQFTYPQLELLRVYEQVEWGEVPDGTIDEDDLPVTVDMNLFLTAGEDRYGWTLDNEPAGITIDEDTGLVTLDGVAAGTYTMTCDVLDRISTKTSNSFAWTIAGDVGPQPPEWDTVPNQSTPVDELPDTLDMTAYVSSLLPITDWETTEGTISAAGLLTIPDGTPEGQLTITVTATNADGAADCDPFTWDITAAGTVPPVIDTDPADIDVTEPASATMTCSASHANGVTYIWEAFQVGWIPAEDAFSDATATAGTLTFNSTHYTDDGLDVRCRVQETGNPGNEVISDTATPTVATQLASVDTEPNNIDTVEPAGGSSTTVGSWNGAEAGWYRWEAMNASSQWVPIEDVLDVETGTEVASTVVISSTSLGDDETNIRCYVRDPSGDVNRQAQSRVIVLNAPRVPATITTQPLDLEVDEPAGGQFYVGAIHPAGAPIYYLWQWDQGTGSWTNANNLSDADGEFSDTLVLSSTVLDDTGQIRCWVRSYQADNDDAVLTNVVDLTVLSSEVEHFHQLFDDLGPVDHTRASIATGTYDDGTMFQVDVDEPVFNGLPAGEGDIVDPQGLQIEPERRNEVPHATDMSQNPHSPGLDITPDATTLRGLPASLCISDGSGDSRSIAIAMTDLATEGEPLTVCLTVTMMAGAEYDNPSAEIGLLNGSTWSTNEVLSIDGPGEVITRDPVEQITGLSTTEPTVIVLRLSIDEVTAGSTNCLIYPGRIAVNTDPVYITGLQVEDGVYPTSLIPSEGAPTTREQVIAEFPLADIGMAPLVNDFCGQVVFKTPYSYEDDRRGYLSALEIRLSNETKFDVISHIDAGDDRIFIRKRAPDGFVYEMTTLADELQYQRGDIIDIRFRCSSTEGMTLWFGDEMHRHNSEFTHDMPEALPNFVLGNVQLATDYPKLAYRILNYTETNEVIESWNWREGLPTNPAIDTQPEAVDLVEPAATAFTIEASHLDDDADLFYAWEWDQGTGDWTPASALSSSPAADQATLTLTSTEHDDNGVIRCRVSAYSADSEYFVVSDEVALRVRAVPEITQQPVDLTVTAPDGGEFYCESTHPEGQAHHIWQAQQDDGQWTNANNVLSDTGVVTQPTLVINSTIPEDQRAVRLRLRDPDQDISTQVYSDEVMLYVGGEPPEDDVIYEDSFLYAPNIDLNGQGEWENYTGFGSTQTVAIASVTASGGIGSEYNRYSESTVLSAYSEGDIGVMPVGGLNFIILQVRSDAALDNYVALVIGANVTTIDITIDGESTELDVGTVFEAGDTARLAVYQGTTYVLKNGTAVFSTDETLPVTLTSRPGLGFVRLSGANEPGTLSRYMTGEQVWEPTLQGDDNG